eukprot:scaffold869_cov260-Chaetoceros_neogracile.AAC.5
MGKRTALVVCDLQPDLLGSLPNREALISSIEIVLEIAKANNWIVIYSGLKFESGYANITETHKLYGALKRLNSKMGDIAVHWFMEGYSGSQVLKPISLENNVDVRVVWRSQHVHNELISLLNEELIENVYVVGAKASGAVQIAMQMMMDQGIEVIAVKECIADDNQERLKATLDHLLPIFGNVISLEELIDDFGGIDSLPATIRQSFIDIMAGNESSALLATDCGRRGHGSRFIELLMERGTWKSYPTQIWYEDFAKGEFYCPLGKKVVDFCDEPEFSKHAMYLLGREHLDEKDKVIEIAGKYMPKTYCLEDGEWVGEMPPSDNEDGSTAAPWFIKESDKNLGGDAIVIVSKPSEIMETINKTKRYVVQQHVKNPLLTDDGCKTHLKFYVLLICEDDGVTWTLYTYRGALLSISPKPWSPYDLCQDTQITIHRHPVPPNETVGWKQHWESVYEKCKAGTLEVIERAISAGKLKGRSKKQFEVFSVDWMPDTDGNVWMFEFNMSPAICQKEFDHPSKRDDRRDFLMQHDEIMLREALAIVLPLEEGNKVPSDWDLAGNFQSKRNEKEQT